MTDSELIDDTSENSDPDDVSEDRVPEDCVPEDDIPEDDVTEDDVTEDDVTEDDIPEDDTHDGFARNDRSAVAKVLRIRRSRESGGGGSPRSSISTTMGSLAV